MSQKYAYETTDVPVSKTKEEIRQLLKKRGSDVMRATEITSMQLIVLEFDLTEKGQTYPIRMGVSTKDKKEKAVWRALLYHLKAKFVAVDFGITSLGEEFLPYIVLQLPQGARTVGEVMLPEISKGRLPPHLRPITPMLPPSRELEDD